MNCPCIRFSLHFSFSFFAFCFSNFTLDIASLVLIVSATDFPLIMFSSELATQNPKLFSSSLMHHSTLIKPLPPSFLFTYNLYASFFGCSAPYIVIVFLYFRSKSFSSLAFRWIISAPHLNIATAHAFIVVALFLPFNLDFKINLCLHLYSLAFFLFHFCFFDLV